MLTTYSDRDIGEKYHDIGEVVQERPPKLVCTRSTRRWNGSKVQRRAPIPPGMASPPAQGTKGRENERESVPPKPQEAMRASEQPSSRASQLLRTCRLC